VIELRTEDNMRKNYWYDDPNKDIKVEFTKGDNKIYSHDVSMGDKPGQYIVNISSTKVFSKAEDNRLFVTIEGIKCTESSLLVIVNHAEVSYGLLFDKNAKQLNSPLQEGNSDNEYKVNMQLFDKFDNIAVLSNNETPNYLFKNPVAHKTKTLIKTEIKLPGANRKYYEITGYPIYSGEYQLISSLLKDNYKFNVKPGLPTIKSIASVQNKAIAGNTVTVFIMPKDKNENYIPPNTLSSNEFKLYYKHQSRDDSNFVDYKEIKESRIASTKDVADLNCNDCSAFAYNVKLTYRFKTSSDQLLTQMKFHGQTHLQMLILHSKIILAPYSKDMTHQLVNLLSLKRMLMKIMPKLTLFIVFTLVINISIELIKYQN
jgi:hypothetical protein